MFQWVLFVVIQALQLNVLLTSYFPPSKSCSIKGLIHGEFYSFGFLKSYKISGLPFGDHILLHTLQVWFMQEPVDYISRSFQRNRMACNCSSFINQRFCFTWTSDWLQSILVLLVETGYWVDICFWQIINSRKLFCNFINNKFSWRIT